MTIALLLCGVATAGRPALELQAAGTFGPGTVDERAAKGLGVEGQLDLAPRLAIGALVQGALVDDADLRLDVAPQLRLYPLGPDIGFGAPSVTGGYGLRLQGGSPVGVGSLGLGYELSGRSGVGARLQTRALLSGETVDVQVSLGLVLRPRAPEPEPVPEPVVEAPPPLRLSPPETWIWVPHPTCRWVTPDELAALDLPEGTRLLLSAPGYREQEVGWTPGLEATLEAKAAQGTLLVAGARGDRVRVSQGELELGAATSTWLHGPEGPVRVEVVGGGRQQALTVALARDHVLWVRPRAPQPLVLHFDLGSSALRPEEAAALAAFAARAGDWRFELVGAASPEGTVDANTALARQRAEVVARALADAGVPSERLRVLDPVVEPGEVDDPALLRRCTVRAVVDP